MRGEACPYLRGVHIWKVSPSDPPPPHCLCRPLRSAKSPPPPSWVYGNDMLPGPRLKMTSVYGHATLNASDPA